MREKSSPDFEIYPAAETGEPVVESRKLRRTGNSYGVTLTRKSLERAGFSAEEPVTVTATPGRVVITKAGSDYDATMEAGRAVLEQYRYALEQLGR